MMRVLTIRASRESSEVTIIQPVVKFTYEDYRTAPGNERCELLDGELAAVHGNTQGPETPFQEQEGAP